jgi:hypothetical protein
MVLALSVLKMDCILLGPCCLFCLPKRCTACPWDHATRPVRTWDSLYPLRLCCFAVGAWGALHALETMLLALFALKMNCIPWDHCACPFRIRYALHPIETLILTLLYCCTCTWTTQMPLLPPRLSRIFCMLHRPTHISCPSRIPQDYAESLACSGDQHECHAGTWDYAEHLYAVETNINVMQDLQTGHMLNFRQVLATSNESAWDCMMNVMHTLQTVHVSLISCIVQNSLNKQLLMCACSFRKICVTLTKKYKCNCVKIKNIKRS